MYTQLVSDERIQEYQLLWVSYISEYTEEQATSTKSTYDKYFIARSSYSFVLFPAYESLSLNFNLGMLPLLSIWEKRYTTINLHMSMNNHRYKSANLFCYNSEEKIYIIYNSEMFDTDKINAYLNVHCFPYFPELNADTNPRACKNHPRGIIVQQVKEDNELTYEAHND